MDDILVDYSEVKAVWLEVKGELETKKKKSETTTTCRKKVKVHL